MSLRVPRRAAAIRVLGAPVRRNDLGISILQLIILAIELDEVCFAIAAFAVIVRAAAAPRLESYQSVVEIRAPQGNALLVRDTVGSVIAIGVRGHSYSRGQNLIQDW